MKGYFAIAAIFVGSVFSSAAQAETCQLHNLDTAAGGPRLVRVYDEDTGAIVWQGPVAGGASISVTVSENRARFDYKYPQDRDYHGNTGFWCKNGESTNF